MPNTALGFFLSGRFLGGYTHFFCVRLGQMERRKWEKKHRRGRRRQKCKVKAVLGLPYSPSREERTHSAYLKTGGI